MFLRVSHFHIHPHATRITGMCFLNLSIHILKYLRFSATNTAQLYDLTLSENLTYLDGWSLGGQLTTKHIWDGFSVVSLVDDHKTQGTLLHIPHTGSQSDHFKTAMEERNKWIIMEGQPNAVCHTCKKCMCIYKREDGEFSKIV